MLSRWPTNSPFASLAASGTLSKFFGLKATNRPFLPSALAAAGSEWVSTSAAMRPASASCWNRRRIAEPPERNISTLMPVSFWNASAIFWPCSIGVEVYQTTLPSALALATSTASCARAGPRTLVKTSAARASVSFSIGPPVSFFLARCARASMCALVDRRRLREEARQDVVADGVVLLMERGVGDARHHRELLVRVGQLLEELHQVGEARDAVVLAAHDQRRHRDLRGIADRQVRAHVDIGAGRHRIVEREDGVGERLDHRVVGGAGMVALEDRAHELAVDRAPVLGAELGQTLAALGQRGRAFAGPHHGVEREPRDHLRMALREQRRAQRARRNPVHQERTLAA